MTVEHEEHSANKVMMLYTTINQSAHLAEILTIERSASLDKNKDAVGLSNEQDDSFRQGLLKRYATLPNPILLATVGKFKVHGCNLASSAQTCP